MSTYRKEWACCGSVTETDSWEPEVCPFCVTEKERDELKARIDGGVRVHAAKYPRNAFEIHAESMAAYPQNATLIIDDEVEL